MKGEKIIMMNEETKVVESKGLVALITGIVSIVLSCLSPLGIVAGIVAIINGNTSKNIDKRGKIGFILGVIGSVLSVAVLIIGLTVTLIVVVGNSLSTHSSYDSSYFVTQETQSDGWDGNSHDVFSNTENTEDISGLHNDENLDFSAGDFDNVITSSYTPAYETIEVGDDAVGYCQVPANFYRFTEAGGTMLPNAVQYAYGYIVIGMQSGTTGGLSAKTFHEALLSDSKTNPDIDPDSVVATKESINGIEGYKLVVYYPADSIYLNTFVFDGTDGQLHYISVEYPASETDYSDLFETVVYNYHY